MRGISASVCYNRQVYGFYGWADCLYIGRQSEGKQWHVCLRKSPFLHFLCLCAEPILLKCHDGKMSMLDSKGTFTSLAGDQIHIQRTINGTAGDTNCRFHGCLHTQQAEWASTLAWHTGEWAVQSLFSTIRKSTTKTRSNGSKLFRYFIIFGLYILWYQTLKMYL